MERTVNGPARSLPSQILESRQPLVDASADVTKGRQSGELCLEVPDRVHRPEFSMTAWLKPCAGS
jgi:hypothetical protein